MPAVGLDGRLFPYWPEAPFNVSMRWDTVVARKLDGSEVRSALQTKPYEGYSFSLLLGEEGSRELRADLLAYPEDRRLVPLAHHELVATQPVTGVVISVDSTALGDLLAVGQRLLIVNRAQMVGYQAVLQSKDATSITVDVTPPAGETFPAHVTSVAPLMACLLAQPVARGYHSVGLTKVDVQARRCEVDQAYGTGAPALATYDGKIVVDDPYFPLVASGGLSPEQTDAHIDVVDFGMAPEYFFSAPFGPVQRAHQLLSKTDADRQYLRKLLHALRGRQKMFLMAAPLPDFVVLDITGDKITVEGNRYTTYYAPGTGAIFGRIRLLNEGTGLYEYVKINSAVDNLDGTEQLTASAVIVDQDARRFSLLEQVRLASDVVPWEWRPGNSSKISVVVVNCLA